VILKDDEMVRSTPCPIKSTMKLGSSGVRGQPWCGVGNTLLQDQRKFERGLQLREEAFSPQVYGNLTLEKSRQEGIING